MVRSVLVVALVAGFLTGGATVAQAQAGAANTTPDRLTYLVNRDRGAERWTIGLNLVAPDSDAIINVTGSIFSPEGGPPQFVTCQVREDSTGSLRDPSSTFRLRCKGSTTCTGTARGCARTEWSLISDDVPISASFFLPAGGRGASSSAAMHVPAIARAILPEQTNGIAEAGATLSYDGATLLVSKDLGSERWAIAVNFFPEDTASGLVRQRLQSITGNVFATDGSPPSFIYCQPRTDSTGTLQDPSSTFRLRCSGASGCGSTASECAQGAWREINDDVALAADFLLPPDGLGDPPPSNGGLVGIGTPSDPGSYPPLFALVSVSGGCPVGAACSLRVGNCANVQGRFVSQAGGCACQVTSVPGQCVLCAGGDTSVCGRSCGYPVGTNGGFVNGRCLPYTSITSSCICYPGLPPAGCGGSSRAGCPTSDRCCADDPTDGCDADSGDISCAGLCVQSQGCDPNEQKCGTCFDLR